MTYGAPVITEETVYDQRQNGSENFRVHVNGIVIVHAPVEALVALASLSDDSGLQQQLLEILGSAGSNATAESTVLASTSTTPISITTSAADEESTSVATAADAVAVSNSTTIAPVKTPVAGENIKPHKKTKFYKAKTPDRKPYYAISQAPVKWRNNFCICDKIVFIF
ncbi:hypothetical protein C0J52_20833 [Blattella germanica]|nr:hypothetical protein C0J52_20833 [Blattella germanica]